MVGTGEAWHGMATLSGVVLSVLLLYHNYSAPVLRRRCTTSPYLEHLYKLALSSLLKIDYSSRSRQAPAPATSHQKPQKSPSQQHTSNFSPSLPVHDNAPQTTQPNISKMTPPKTYRPAQHEESTEALPRYDEESQLLLSLLHPRGWYQHTIAQLVGFSLIAFCLCLLMAEITAVTYLVKVSVDIFRRTWLRGE